ncbi:MAG: peptidoglycan DD-metalloendopeptidase family protein [Gammaproteobacteria bacterium]|nr:peptidoglycan DD-metalloendopeptidase family protein [Gammaproteobacteria bacterium]
MNTNSSIHALHFYNKVVTDDHYLTSGEIMLFISHAWVKKNLPYEFAKNSDYAYQTFVACATANSNCAQSSGAADLVSNKEGRQLFNIFRLRYATMIVLMYLISCSAGASNEMPFHKVRAGETLSVIANLHGVSYRYLACLNGISNPNRISIGQRIWLPRARRKAQSINLEWPINQGRMTSFFGLRHGDCHYGIDIAAPRGTPVRVAGNGKVVFSGIQNGYGEVVIVRHSKGYRTLYAHLNRIYVKTNQRLRRGQKIAKVGSSGRSTGPHLHFEVQENGKAHDPMTFLPKKTQIVLNPKALYGIGRGGK